MRRPLVKLELPIGDRRQRNNDEVRSVVALHFHQVGYQGYSLDCLAETHLVSQNTVQIIVVQRYEPFETLKKVLP